MALPLSHLPGEIIREVRQRKWLAFFVFLVISFGVLAVGFIYPYQYKSDVIIYVDDKNIIEPLLEGSAVTTKINDRASAAEELLWTRDVINKVATDTNIFGPDAASVPDEDMEARIAKLRNNLNVRRRGESFFSIGYRAENPVRAFHVAQKLGQVFIAESTRRQRSESRNAYEFIDKQVRSYESQLGQSEQKLKKFLSENTDGTEGQANQKMSGLRGKIELAKLNKEETITRVQALENQLNNVSSTFQQGRSENVYQTRIIAMQQKLDQLRLKYHDSYPDIVIMREQLAELKKQREKAASGGGDVPQYTESQSIANPVYQDLSSQLAQARTQIQTINTRINSLNSLLEEQKTRMERIQGNKAEYSDLTRDTETNKQIYNDLLKRRERARMSMTLDVQGQGARYRINETAQFPLKPDGLQFFQFAAIGLLLGILAPFGAVAGLLQVDPRVRTRSQLESEAGLPVLVEIPHIRTPFEKRRNRKLTIAVILCSLGAIVVYIAIAVASVMGVL